MDVHVSLVGRKDLRGEIYRQLRRAVVDGRLRPGDSLPATRELARSLGVSRTTVSVAYDRLAGEGFVTSRVGAGTFVTGAVAPSVARAEEQPGSALRARDVWTSFRYTDPFVPPVPFDFRSGVPDASRFPFTAWRRLMARELRTEAVRGASYGHPAGHRRLRVAIARHLGISRGVGASADDVIIASGTQQSIDVIARVLLAPGDRVAVEDPGYPLPRALFRTLGARVTGIPVDDQGLVVDALPPDTRLVYVTPSHQYPLGVSLSLQRRVSLLEWAERHDAAIIEDDYDSEFRFGGRPIEPLQTLDTSGRVIYVGSFSKTMLPTLRLGFLVAPPSLRDALVNAKWLTDWHTSMLGQATLAAFIDDGSFARHIRRMQRVYSVRHELLTTTLARDFADHLEVVPSTIGLHIAAVARSATAARIVDAVRRAMEAGVAVQELARFGMDGHGPPGVLMGYGAIATDRIEEGLDRLKRAFE
jgi:GntR family transcriptional regulator/MocR family aminotransferase